MGLILSVLLITAFLAGYLLLALVIFAPQGPAWRVVRRARIAVVSGRVYNLDREYEELLRR